MAPDGASSIVLSGDGSTSNRLAATVAGQGSDQSAYRQGFKAYSRPLDEHIESGSKPQYVLVEDVTPEQFESFVAEGKKIVGEENFFVNNTASPSRTATRTTSACLTLKTFSRSTSRNASWPALTSSLLP